MLIGTAPVRAQSPPNAPEEPPAQQAEASRSLPETVRRVERQTGGEVLRAEPMQRDGREVSRLKVLTSDGRVRVVQADPNATGPAALPERPRSSRNEQEKPPSRDSDGKPPQF